ncbi:L-lactate dehydrogenase [Natranaerovirga hydrolytica]|uniref:L-lactate dehydrogenase n=1 Tax=Natranaerovirga hydrolytica TaxID=680378 RepID=A0A4R1N1A4_9FIRM|nr:L-lactate dehydrogenase [Natranaerovirga hydrolytica]TCK97774.1 L-lactate dehydrogenase [Natranaerovirga hydrolytica]
MIQSRKIVIIGAGHVGSHCGYSLLTQGDVNEIVYIDIDRDKAEAQAGDIADAGCFMPHPISVRVGDYKDCRDADIVVLAAGVPRKEGQTRLDTMGDSIKVMKEIVDPLKGSGFEGILICISNPADIIAYYMMKHTGWPKNRVLSTGTSLDTARLKRVLKEAIGVDPRSIQCFSMGEHGDSSMIPFSHITIGGKPLRELMLENPQTYGTLDLDCILERTRRIGMDIVIGKGSTEFGIGTVLADMVKAILHNEHRIMPVSTLLEGEYGQEDICVGVPAIISKKGVEKIMELNLNQSEKQLFEQSCDIIRKHMALAQQL